MENRAVLESGHEVRGILPLRGSGHRILSDARDRCSSPRTILISGHLFRSPVVDELSFRLITEFPVTRPHYPASTLGHVPVPSPCAEAGMMGTLMLMEPGKS